MSKTQKAQAKAKARERAISSYISMVSYQSPEYAAPWVGGVTGIDPIPPPPPPLVAVLTYIPTSLLPPLCCPLVAILTPT